MNGKTQSMLQDGYYLVAKIENGIVKPLGLSAKKETNPAQKAATAVSQWSKAGIPIMCKETKKQYPSIRQASIVTGLSCGVIRRALEQNREVHGMRFTYVK